MVKRAREFLMEGDKVRFVVKFRGRQVTRPEFGFATARKAIEALSDVAKVERDPHMEGRQLVAIVSFERKKTNEKKTENKEVSIETV
jgi:translation initiation factor IF-3